MQSASHNIVIKADKTPVGEHLRKVSSPTIDEVLAVIVGENLNSSYIVLHRRNKDVKFIFETHMTYDALQYSLLFWQDANGYHFKMKMVNQLTSG